MSAMTNALAQYFEATGDNVSKLAERIGRAPSSITRPLKGQRNASMELARDVERGTDGKVTASQFIDICLHAGAKIETASSASETCP